MERVQAWERIHAQHRARSLGKAGSAMVATFDLDGLAKAVSETFPVLGIASCYVAVHEQGERQPPAERRSRLILAYDVAVRAARRPEYIVFESADLVPAAFLPRGREHAFVVAPLLYDTEDLGLLVLELGAAEGFVYEALRQLFSAAIKGAQTIDAFNAEVQHRNTLTPRLSDGERRLSALAPLHEGLGATIERCRALASAAEPFSDGLRLLETELVRLHDDLGVLLTPSLLASVASAAPPSGALSSPRAHRMTAMTPHRRLGWREQYPTAADEGLSESNLKRARVRSAPLVPQREKEPHPRLLCCDGPGGQLGPPLGHRSVLRPSALLVAGALKRQPKVELRLGLFNRIGQHEAGTGGAAQRRERLLRQPCERIRLAHRPDPRKRSARRPPPSSATWASQRRRFSLPRPFRPRSRRRSST